MKKLIFTFFIALSLPYFSNAQLYPADYDDVDFAFDSLYSYKYQKFLEEKDSIALYNLYQTLDDKISSASTTNELIITNSSIRTLPLDISSLSNLEKVEFANCKSLDLAKILDQLADLPIKSLAFTNCALYSIPDNIAKMTSLESLSLKENKIVRLNTYIGTLPHLKHLDVSNNSVLNEEILFSMIPNMLQLTHLEANYCAIRSLPRIGVANIEKLSIAGNLLSELNLEVRASTLDISANPYLDIELVLEQLASNKNLKHLNLSYNKWPVLPANIGNLINLVSLDLRGNELTSLPDEIGKLISLEVLKVDNPDAYLKTNQLTSLPLSIGNLLKLDSLFLSGNKLTNLPNSFGKLSKLEFLDLSWNKFDEFPKAILTLNNLAYLNLAINHIKIIPEEIGNLKNLSYLNFQGDFFVNYQLKIKDIPSSIGQLIKLETLILSDNVIEQVPASIGECNLLRNVDLKDNLLSSLPDSFGKLILLESLNLKANEIVSLPSSFSNLESLSMLNLSFNFNIESLAASNILKGLIELKELNLIDCYFTEEAIIQLQKSLSETIIITQVPEK